MPGGAATVKAEEEIRARNPDVAFFHARRGCCVSAATFARMTAAFVAQPYVTRGGAPHGTTARFVVEDRRSVPEPA